MGQATSTLVIELVVVSMAVAVGAVLMADVWPAPDLPLYWMGGAAGIFFVYAVIAAVRDMRTMLRTQVVPELADGDQAAQSAPAEQGPNADEVDAPEEVSSPKPALVLGAPSEEATAFLSVEELRKETEADDLSPDVPSVPLFAESSLYSTAELAAGAKALQAESAQEDSAQNEPAEPGADDPGDEPKEQA